MYPNLVAETAKAGLKNRLIAKTVGVHENTISNLMQGKTKASIEIAFSIKANFFPQLSLEYLFEYKPNKNNKVN